MLEHNFIYVAVIAAVAGLVVVHSVLSRDLFLNTFSIVWFNFKMSTSILWFKSCLDSVML